MLNQYPLWRYIFIALVVIPGLLYALPNLFGNDPGLQVRGTRATRVDTQTLENVTAALQAAGINPREAALDDGSIRFRFEDTEQQLKAREVVDDALGNRFTSALSLLPSTPKWLSSVGGNPMFLGLDLRGGVYFLLEVDIEAAYARQLQSYADSSGDLRRILREEAEVRHRGVNVNRSGKIEVRFNDGASRAKARDAIERLLPDLTIEERDGESPLLLLSLSEQSRKEIRDSAIDKNMTALRNRVDELGVAEPLVQRQGDRRIVVQLPGVQDSSQAKEILGKTATLEFKLVDEEHSVQSAIDGRVPPGSKLYKMRDGVTDILLYERLLYSGENIVDAAATFDNQGGGGAIVSITLDSRGTLINQRVTGENVGKRMAAVFVEDQTEVQRDASGKPIIGEDGRQKLVTRRLEEVITAPVIRDQLGKRYQIEGLDGIQEANDIALLLRAGSLAAPMRFVEERTVGPSLGRDNIKQGFRSVTIGFVLVLIFMAIYYRFFGIVANVALALNLVLLVAVLSLLQATLTLPGVAGIVLTVGMAVDANVLIFERIREELRVGNTPQASIHVGYSRAFSTIVDANVTTLIAAIVLFVFGTGPIKGFAITLSVGIVTSMFTAIFVTRAVVNYFYGGRKLEKLAI